MSRAIRPIRIEGDIAYVPLTKGYEAVIDAADVPLVEGCSWHVKEIRGAHGVIKAIYAGASNRHGGKRRTVYMHRVILGGDAPIADHRDGNGLNNKRENLRPVTAVENAHNRKRHLNNSTGFKGVQWCRTLGKWRPSIMVRGKRFYLGVFDDIAKAAAAYAAASAKLHGEYGRPK